MKEKVFWKKKANSVPLHYNWKTGSRHTHQKKLATKNKGGNKEIGFERLTEILPTSCNPSIQIQCV